jgi:hypothetical protein
LWGALVDASASPRHLSLSLSLYSWSESAENGARTSLLAGFSRAHERGFRDARRRPTDARRRPTAAAPLFACARICAPAVSGRRGASRSRTHRAWRAACVLADLRSVGRRDAPPIVVLRLGCPPHNPWGTSEEALSRAVFPRVGFVGPKRRGLVPNPGPRRALFAVLIQRDASKRVLFERRCDCPSPVAAHHKGFSPRGEGAVTKQFRLVFGAGPVLAHSVLRPGVVSPDARVRRASDKTSVRARPYHGIASRRRVSQKAGIRCELFPEGYSSWLWRCAS